MSSGFYPKRFSRAFLQEMVTLQMLHIVYRKRFNDDANVTSQHDAYFRMSMFTPNRNNHSFAILFLPFRKALEFTESIKDSLSDRTV